MFISPKAFDNGPWWDKRHCQPLRKVIFSVRMPELYIRCQTCFISDTASDEAVIMHKDLDRWSSCVDCWKQESGFSVLKRLCEQMQMTLHINVFCMKTKLEVNWKLLKYNKLTFKLCIYRNYFSIVALNFHLFSLSWNLIIQVLINNFDNLIKKTVFS